MYFIGVHSESEILYDPQVEIVGITAALAKLFSSLTQPCLIMNIFHCTVRLLVSLKSSYLKEPPFNFCLHAVKGDIFLVRENSNKDHSQKQRVGGNE